MYHLEKIFFGKTYLILFQWWLCKHRWKFILLTGTDDCLIFTFFHFLHFLTSSHCCKWSRHTYWCRILCCMLHLPRPDRRYPLHPIRLPELLLVRITEQGFKVRNLGATGVSCPNYPDSNSLHCWKHCQSEIVCLKILGLGIYHCVNLLAILWRTAP